MKTGFIGAGIMGSRMAANLLESSFNLSITNRTKRNAEPLIDKGAKWYDSPSEMAPNVDIIITMLSMPEVVEKAALGENGFLNMMNKGSIWMDCSTVNPKFSLKMAEECENRSLHFIDAPVSGSLIPAEKGELLFLVGGHPEIIEKCVGYFNCMGRDFIHAGENGKGSALKMVVNMLMANALVAYSEAVSLGSAWGIEKNRLISLLLEMPMVAPIVKLKKDNFEMNDYPTHFPLKWAHKDLHLASVSAYEKKISLPLANSVKELYALAKQKGYQEMDFSAIFDFINSVEKDIG